MSIALLYNCHGTWNCQGIDAADGKLFHAVGFAENRDCRNVASHGFSIVDCDPATWDLPYEPCSKVCNKMATHSFIPIATPAFSQWRGAKSEWLPQAVAPVVAAAWPPALPIAAADVTSFLAGCLEWQSFLRPSGYILPTLPLVGSSPDLDGFIKWLRAAIQAGREFAEPGPRFVAVTVEDSLLPAISEVILDQLTAREGVDGVYLNVITSGAQLSERFSESVARSLYGFVRDLSKHRTVFVNGWDIFGVVAIGAGAVGIGIGYELKGSRLNLQDFRNSDSRGAFPRMLSLAFCKRLSIEEVETIRNAGLLDRLEFDRTEPGGLLLDAVAARQDIRTLDPWRPQAGRVATARKHFILNHAKAVQTLSARSVPERETWVQDWLKMANTNVDDYCSALGKRPQQVGMGHVGEWLRALIS